MKSIPLNSSVEEQRQIIFKYKQKSLTLTMSPMALAASPESLPYYFP